MVKIKNIYGDICIGRKDNAVYQRKYGQAMRRVYNDNKPPATPLQEAQRDKFKEGIAYAKSLSKAEIGAIKEYMKEKNIGWNDGDPIHWFNWAKNLSLITVEFNVFNEVTQEYRVKHPAISKIEELDADRNIVFTIDDLSNILDKRFLDTYIQTPIGSCRFVRVTTLPGKVFEYPIGFSTKIVVTFPCPS